MLKEWPMWERLPVANRVRCKWVVMIMGRFQVGCSWEGLTWEHRVRGPLGRQGAAFPWG